MRVALAERKELMRVERNSARGASIRSAGTGRCTRTRTPVTMLRRKNPSWGLTVTSSRR